MGSAKWIAGFLGWVTWGPIGALLGFLAGSVWDSAMDSARQLMGDKGTEGPGESHAGPRGFSAAAEKFRQVQEAYETIKRERGMN